MRRLLEVGGQASLEVVGGAMLLMLAGLVAFQVFAVGYAASLVDGAAQAGAVALARGESAELAVESALPGWAAERARVVASGERVRVELDPPSVVGSLSRSLEVSATSVARRGD